MGEIEMLIAELVRKKDPLGRSVQWGEVPSLTKALQVRFGEDLDLSPGSLKKLEDRLLRFFQDYQERGQTLTNDELVQLVREITAYLGYVLVNHAGGEWFHEATSLLGNRVKITEQWTIIKEGRKIQSPEVHFVIGGEAAFSIDEAIEGKRPRLYRLIQDIKKKTIRERLK